MRIRRAWEDCHPLADAVEVELTRGEMEAAFRIVEEMYRSEDVADILEDAYGDGRLDEKEYLQVYEDTGFYKAVLQRYREIADKGIPYNDSMRSAVREVLEGRARSKLLGDGGTGVGGSASGDKVYVLYGYWDTLEEKDAMVIRVSPDPELVMEELDRIADSKASAYAELQGELQEEQGEGYYEVMDASCRYARFYIVGKTVNL